MKNLFKKSKQPVKPEAQVLDKKQLEKVIGGVEGGKLSIPLSAGPSGTTN